jgi:hypothetical protein
LGHLDDGLLRRLIDEPFAITDSERQHVQSCRVCRARQAEVVADARAVDLALKMPDMLVDAAPALMRVQSRLGTERRRRFSHWMPRRLTKPLGGVAAVAALVGALTLTPAGSLAQSLLTVFQPSQVVTIPVTASELRTLPDLQQYGTVQAPAHMNVRQVSDPQQAAAATGMAVLTPSSLPAGTPSNVRYQVIPGGTAAFTFNAAKARASAAAQGKTLAAMPALIDGSTLRLTVRPAIIAWYGNQKDFPPLVIGQMKAPTITSSRASVKEIEDYVLGLPGIPPQLASQLRSIQDPTSTLPIPVPIDLASSQKVQVQGVSGVAIGDSTGVGSVVFWAKDGVMYGVGGTMTEDQVVAVANSLR